MRNPKLLTAAAAAAALVKCPTGRRSLEFALRRWVRDGRCDAIPIFGPDGDVSCYAFTLADAKKAFEAHIKALGAKGDRWKGR